MKPNFYRKMGRKLTIASIVDLIKRNKRASLLITGVCIVLLYVLFNSNGIIPRLRLESEKKAMELNIKQAEEEQKKLKEQSKALDGDKKAIEKVAREKYGMVRKGEKVYKVAPKK